MLLKVIRFNGRMPSRLTIFCKKKTDCLSFPDSPGVIVLVCISSYTITNIILTISSVRICQRLKLGEGSYRCNNGFNIILCGAGKEFHRLLLCLILGMKIEQSKNTLMVNSEYRLLELL